MLDWERGFGGRGFAQKGPKWRFDTSYLIQRERSTVFERRTSVHLKGNLTQPEILSARDRAQLRRHQKWYEVMARFCVLPRHSVLHPCLLAGEGTWNGAEFPYFAQAPFPKSPNSIFYDAEDQTSVSF